VVETIDYAEAVAELDEALERTAADAHAWLVREGLDAAGQAVVMQRLCRDLEEVRAQALERLDALWARVNSAGPATLQ
jgi:hypothetical protein